MRKFFLSSSLASRDRKIFTRFLPSFFVSLVAVTVALLSGSTSDSFVTVN